jgi:hypothetical protein
MAVQRLDGLLRWLERLINCHALSNKNELMAFTPSHFAQRTNQFGQ